MARTSNLIQRKGRWYYNRAIPKELWPTLGRAPFRISLHTDSLELAQRRRPDAERRYYAYVDVAREKLAKSQPIELSEIEVTALVVSWFKREDEARTEELNERRRGYFDLDGYLEELNDYEAEARQAIAEDDLSEVAPQARRLLAEEGFAFDRKSQSVKLLQRGPLRGRRQLALLERERLLGDYGVQATDPLFKNLSIETHRAPRRTIADLIAAHKADKVDRRALSTQASYEPVWRLLKDVLGEKRDISTITREDGRVLFEAVKALPRGVGKIKALAGLKI